jgi:hypothetical protein
VDVEARERGCCPRSAVSVRWVECAVRACGSHSNRSSPAARLGPGDLGEARRTQGFFAARPTTCAAAVARQARSLISFSIVSALAAWRGRAAAGGRQLLCVSIIVSRVVVTGEAEAELVRRGPKPEEGARSSSRLARFSDHSAGGESKCACQAPAGSSVEV